MARSSDTQELRVKVKSILFSASYGARKEKESHEHIGFFKAEEEALRVVLKEAKRRRKYEMAAKINIGRSSLEEHQPSNWEDQINRSKRNK